MAIANPPAPPANPPATPPAQPPATPAAEPAPFEVKEPVKNRLLSLFMDGKPVEPAEPSKPAKEEPKAATPTPDAAPAPAATEPEPDKKTKVKKKVTPAVDPVEHAARVGATIAKEIISQHHQTAVAEPKPASTPPPPTPADVPAKHQRKLAILEQMAAERPDRYKTIVDDFKRSVTRVDEYQGQWERNNPGKRFDPEDEEHDAFFKVNDIDYDEDDYHEAIASLKIKPLAEVAKKAEKLEGELADVRKKEKERALEPTIAHARTVAAAEMVKAIDPKILDHAKTPEALQAYINDSPDEAEIVLGHAQMAGALVSEGVRLLKGGEVKHDDPTTQDFFAIKNHLEAEIKRQPQDEQLDERGRRFVTWQEFIDLSAKDPQATNRYWFLGEAELAKLIPAETAKIAKEKLSELDKRFERLAKARGFTKASAPPAGAKAKNGEPTPPPQPAAPSTPPPAQARTQIDPVRQPNGQAEPEEWRKNLLSVFSGTRV